MVSRIVRWIHSSAHHANETLFLWKDKRTKKGGKKKRWRLSHGSDWQITETTTNLGDEENFFFHWCKLETKSRLPGLAWVYKVIKWDVFICPLPEQTGHYHRHNRMISSQYHHERTGNENAIEKISTDCCCLANLMKARKSFESIKLVKHISLSSTHIARQNRMNSSENKWTRDNIEDNIFRPISTNTRTNVKRWKMNCFLVDVISHSMQTQLKNL